MGAALKHSADAKFQDAAFQNSPLPSHRGKADLDFLLLTAAQELSSTFTLKMEPCPRASLACIHQVSSVTWPCSHPLLTLLTTLEDRRPLPSRGPWVIFSHPPRTHVLLSPLPSTMSILSCLLILIEIDSGFSQSKCMYPPLTPPPSS